MSGADFLAALGRKANLGPNGWQEGDLFLFRTEDVVARPRAEAISTGSRDAVDLAAAWLGKLVRPDGRVCFAIDPRSGARHELGPMHHGRTAVVLRALDLHGRHRPLVLRARARLTRDIVNALDGRSVEGWPADEAQVGGTLALAALAGLPVRDRLQSFAESSRRILGSPWHAAQIVAALGSAAPSRLWQACVEDLRRQPWAPWTAFAAHARGDRRTFRAATEALIASVRRTAPYVGGIAVTSPIPEVALTAVVVEALALARSERARSARRRACDFLRRWQLLPGRIPAPLDERLALGAFAPSPVGTMLRGDITGHAVLALLLAREQGVPNGD